VRSGQSASCWGLYGKCMLRPCVWADGNGLLNSENSNVWQTPVKLLLYSKRPATLLMSTPSLVPDN
jgi:hypothetical protein